MTPHTPKLRPALIATCELIELADGETVLEACGGSYHHAKRHRKHISELVKLGIVHITGRRKCSISGYKAHTYGVNK